MITSLSSQAVEEYLVGKRGRGRKFWGRKSRLKKNGGGEEYKVVGNFVHPIVSLESIRFTLHRGQKCPLKRPLRR